MSWPCRRALEAWSRSWKAWSQPSTSVFLSVCEGSSAHKLHRNSESCKFHAFGLLSVSGLGIPPTSRQSFDSEKQSGLKKALGGLRGLEMRWYLAAKAEHCSATAEKDDELRRARDRQQRKEGQFQGKVDETREIFCKFMVSHRREKLQSHFPPGRSCANHHVLDALLKFHL